MKLIARWERVLLVLALCAVALPPAAFSDDDDDDEREESRHGGRERGSREGGRAPAPTLKPPTDPTYTNVCSECHNVYQPELLPTRSWTNLLDHLDDHFGETVEITPKERAALLAYLPAHAAEKSSAKPSVAILRSLGDATPKRITETPYIKGKHREISAKVLRRNSIGSLSNCSACHRHASGGVFNEHDVRIPKN